MAEWNAITLDDLLDEINESEINLNGQLWNFWQLIKIYPTKWEEYEYGNDGGGFWVVAICGTKIIWYNDIEEGFNISSYTSIGTIDDYNCNQDELSWAVFRFFDLVKFGGDVI